MYAIVEIAGKQYKVQENDKLVVPRLDAEVDDTVVFDRVLLVADGDDVQLGTPAVDGAHVSAKVLEHVKGDKVLVFRKKRRKRFKVLRGHRQPYTRIEVGELSLNGNGKAAKKSAAPKKEKAAPAKAEKPAEAAPAPDTSADQAENSES